MFIIVFMFFSTFLFGQDYQLDKSFGNQGVSFVNFPGDEIFAIAYDGLLWDDSYLVECYVDDGYEINMFMKFDRNGELDTTFANHGKLIADVSYFDGPLSFTILPTGNIALAGVDNLDNIVIYEYDKSGNQDKILTIDSAYDSFYPTEIISNDKNIFIGGSVESDWISSEEGFFIMKMDFDGKIDSTFGENGLFVYKKDSMFNTLNDLISYDGGLLFSFAYNDSTFQDINYSLGKLDNLGKLDQSFGEGGITDLGTMYFGEGDYAELYYDNDLNIFFRIVGSPFITKIDKAGNPVLSYGENGVFAFDFDLWGDVLMGFSKKLDDGSIMEFGGSSEYFDEGQPLIMKVASNGQIDTVFGTKGFISGYFGGNSIYYNGILNDDGTIVALGGQGLGGITQNIMLVKYKPTTSANKEINSVLTDFKVFPNPVLDGKLSIAFDLKEKSLIEISLFSMTGDKVQTYYKGVGKKGENLFKFDMFPDIQSGTYFIRIMDDSGMRYKKVNIINK